MAAATSGRRFLNDALEASAMASCAELGGMADLYERCGGGFPETVHRVQGWTHRLVMGNQEYGTGLITS